jgi:hypothetical protein
LRAIVRGKLVKYVEFGSMSNNIKVHVISFVEKQSFFPVEIGVRLFELGIRWVRVAAMERSFRAQKENFLKWRNKEKKKKPILHRDPRYVWYSWP